MSRLVISCILLCISFGHAQADLIPAEHFAKPREYYDAVLSPDGKYIAIERAADRGKTLVAVIDADSLKLMSHIPASSGASPVNPRWVSNDRVVVEFTEGSRSKKYEHLNGELMAMNANGKKKRKIIEHQAFVTSGKDKRANNLHGAARVVHNLPKDKKNVLISFFEWGQNRSGRVYKLYKLNVITGKPNQIAVAPSYDAYFTLSREGEPRFSIGRDKSIKDENVLVTHKYVDGKWQKLEPKGLENAEVFTVIAETENPAEVYVKASFEKKTDRVYRYNLETGDKKLAFAHPKVDAQSFDIDPVTNQLVAVHFQDGLPNIHLVDQNHLYSRWYPSLFQLFEGKRVKITSGTKDGEKIIVHASGANEPGQFHLFNTKTKKIRYLFNAASWIKPELLSEVKPFSMKARDGLELHGYLTTPRTGKAPYPMVVMPHGGPHGPRDWWTYDSEVQFLASRGYAVLQVNFRGSGGYGLGFEWAGHKKWGSDIQHDIIDATKWAANQQNIDGKRLCIMGGSFGGYSALMSPIIEPDLYKCAIGMVGVYDLNLMWTTGDIEDYRSGENYLNDVIGKDKAELDKFSPVKRINELKAPVFIAHGASDWRVDVKHFHVLKKALEAKNHPFESMLEKGEGHGFYSEENRIKYFKRVEAFLAKYIGS